MYGVALQVEDYMSLSDPEPLSSVGTQFLLNVYHSEDNCSSQPKFSMFTRADGACVAIPENTTYVERFYATTGSNDAMYVILV